MAKKLRIGVLFNEPTGGVDAGRKYITANGQIQEVTPPGGRSGAARKEKSAPVPVSVDLSEIGVVEEMDDIKDALNSLGYKTTTLNVDSNIYRLMEYLRTEKPDLVFNLVECVENESSQEMNVAGIYELMKIAYTGAPPLALGIALNKPLVKEILHYHGIRTPRFQVFKPSDKIALSEELEFPVIIKPVHEDASVGIANESVVYNNNDLRRRVRYIFEELEQPALVEQYIDGRELNVAMIGNKNPIVLPISEIDFGKLPDDMHKIVSYDAKWVHGSAAYAGTNGVCPAPLTANQEGRLKDIALRCFQIIGCRDYARVDFRLTREGTPYVLEVNPNPDISDDAGFARSARSYGLSFPETVGKIVESALERAHAIDRS